jgi:hypothetical protein
MQQVQKVNDYCTPRENCPKSNVAYNIFSTIEQKKNEKKNNDKQQFSPVRRV